MFKNLSIALAAILISCCLNYATAECDDPTWTPYKDEKCFKLIDIFVAADEAESICSQFTSGDSSPLLTIKTPEEAEFISNFLYTNSSVVDNVWIAASRLEATNNFIWNHDKSPIDFSNWSPSSPSNDLEKSCVHLTSRLSNLGVNAADGEWTDVSCIRRNLVVCQKQQQLNPSELIEIVLDNRKRILEAEIKIVGQEVKIIESEVKIAEQAVKIIDAENKIGQQGVKIENAETKIADQGVKIADSQTKIAQQGVKIVASEIKIEELEVKIEVSDIKITQLETQVGESEVKIAQQGVKIADAETKIAQQASKIANLTEELVISNARVVSLENNPVPIGFIYVQLASQASPTTLWPNTEWTDVTSTYAGRFFRAEGGDSAPFGSNQDADYPHIDRFTTVLGGRIASNRVNVTAGKTSASIFSGGLSSSGSTSINVRMTSGENRPINSAVRIFQRRS